MTPDVLGDMLFKNVPLCWNSDAFILLWVIGFNYNMGKRRDGIEGDVLSTSMRVRTMTPIPDFDNIAHYCDLI